MKINQQQSDDFLHVQLGNEEESIHGGKNFQTLSPDIQYKVVCHEHDENTRDSNVSEDDNSGDEDIRESNVSEDNNSGDEDTRESNVSETLCENNLNVNNVDDNLSRGDSNSDNIENVLGNESDYYYLDYEERRFWIAYMTDLKNLVIYIGRQKPRWLFVYTMFFILFSRICLLEYRINSLSKQTQLEMDTLEESLIKFKAPFECQVENKTETLVEKRRG